ncbi:MAG TPA: RNA methyltransferase [Pontimonas sp.]|nr:RNA methyltransferase [Pontimonas sp.]
MTIIHHLDSGSDERLSDYRDLTDVALRSVREPAEGIYIAESLKVLERALMAGHRPLSALTTSQWLERLIELCEQHREVCADMPVYVGSDQVLENLTGFHVHRGTLASIARPPLPSVRDLLEGCRRVVVLENIVDHTNVGAVFRSVAGIGADAVIVSESCADPLYRRSVRVSMGTVMQVPWTRSGAWSDLVSDLKDAGFEIAALGLTPEASPLDEFALEAPEKLALVLGTEGDGLSREALRSADHVVSIPMRGSVDSLNVAAASAVAMWALR